MSEYIKKEDALKQQMLLWDDDGKGFMAVDVHRLNQLPTYSFPEREKGEWIEKEGYDGDTYYDCSVCGNSWTTIEGTPWDNGMDFCPNCGADMRGGKE